MALSASTRNALDFAPLLVFFGVFYLADMWAATAALIAATAASLGIIYAYERKVAAAPLISGALVLVFGGLSLALHDERFIKMKPTAVYITMASVLLVGVFGFRKGLLRYLFGPVFELTESGWCALSRNWAFFCLFLAALNELMWRSFSTETWVNHKVFGATLLTVLFMMSQMKLIERYRAAPKDTPANLPDA